MCKNTIIIWIVEFKHLTLVIKIFKKLIQIIWTKF